MDRLNTIKNVPLSMFYTLKNSKTGKLEQSNDSYLTKTKKDPQLNAFETTVKGQSKNREKPSNWESFLLINYT